MTENLYDTGTEELFKNAAIIIGENIQFTIAAEECNELSAELMRFLRGRHDVDKIADEIADVLICAHQLRILWGKEWVDRRVTHKLERFRIIVEQGESV